MTPTIQTLRRYGLSLDEWQSILDRQGGRCPICLKIPTTLRWVVDHEHLPKWKQKPPEQRKLAIRGITCWFCNRNLLVRGVTSDKLRRAADYLDEYERRKQNGNINS